MHVISSCSPVLGEHFVEYVQEVVGITIASEKLPEFLRRWMAQESLGYWHLRVEPVGGDTCWLLRTDRTQCGLFVRVRNTPQGVRILGLRDLGGGRKCGEPLLI